MWRKGQPPLTSLPVRTVLRTLLLGIEEIAMRFHFPLLKARAATLRYGVIPVAGFAIKLLGGGPRLRCSVLTGPLGFVLAVRHPAPINSPDNLS